MNLPGRLLVVGWALLLSAAKVEAQESSPGPGTASQRALAEVLFRSARELMDQGKVAPACAKFAESQRLDPALGTLLNLAVCHETDGRLASAWAEYNQAAALAKRRGDTDRYEFSLQASRRLEGRFGTARIGLSPAAEKLPELKLQIDRREIGRAALDVPIPLDPGAHALTADAPGHRPWSTTITVNAETREVPVTVPALEPLPALPAAEREPWRREPAPSDDVAPRDDGRAQRTWGIAVGGVGLAGVAVGAVFGIQALTKKNDRDELCTGGDCETQAGVDAHRDANRAATVSNIGFIAGGALLATGVVLYLTAPSTSERHATSERPRVAMRPLPSGASLALERPW